MISKSLKGDASNPESWWKGQKYDRIFWMHRAQAVVSFVATRILSCFAEQSISSSLPSQQLRLLQALWPLLNEGGKLLYATCSILPQENENIVHSFLSAEETAKELDIMYTMVSRANMEYKFCQANTRWMASFMLACKKNKYPSCSVSCC